jgi:hypothetical protein
MERNDDRSQLTDRAHEALDDLLNLRMNGVVDNVVQDRTTLRVLTLTLTLTLLKNISRSNFKRPSTVS